MLDINHRNVLSLFISEKGFTFCLYAKHYC